MSFLTPLSALLLAAAAIPLLVLLYLLKLRRQPVRIPSTLLWKQMFQDLQANVPFQKLRYTPLLLVQLLLLIVLLLAFAQPILRGGIAPASRMILLIDTSASMQATDIDPKDKSRTRLDEAIEQARDIVNSASRADTPSQIMIIAFGSTPRIISSYESNRAILLDALDQIEPTDENADLARALDLAGAFATQTEIAVDASEVILFSDGGVGSPPDAGGFNLRAGRFRFVQIVPPSNLPINNIGITAFTARRSYDNPSQVDVFARLINTNPSPVEIIATLTADNADAVPLILTIPPATQDTQPGQRSFTATLDLPGSALLTLRHNYKDSLASDDVAALVLPAPSAPRIAVVHPDDTNAENASNSGGADPFLVDLFRATNPRQLNVLSASQFNTIDGDQIDTGAFYDFIVFDRVKMTRLPNVPTLTFGAVQPPLNSIEPTNPGGQSALSWDRSHPIMQHVELDPLRFSDFGGFELPEGATPLAWGPDGPIIALMRLRGVNHVDVGFALRKSNWALNVSIAVFIQNVIDQATGGRSPDASSHQPGAMVSVTPTAEIRTIRIEGPISIEVPTNDGSPVTIPPLRLAGLYTVIGAQSPLNTIAVSMLNDAESNIHPNDLLRVNAEQAVSTASGDAAGKPLWPWLIAAAVALSVLEWLAWCARARA